MITIRFATNKNFKVLYISNMITIRFATNKNLLHGTKCNKCSVTTV